VQPIGVVVNPLSGKDIRRLSGKASVFDNREKEAIVVERLQGPWLQAQSTLPI